MAVFGREAGPDQSFCAQQEQHTRPAGLPLQFATLCLRGPLPLIQPNIRLEQSETWRRGWTSAPALHTALMYCAQPQAPEPLSHACTCTHTHSPRSHVPRCAASPYALTGHARRVHVCLYTCVCVCCVPLSALLGPPSPAHTALLTPSHRHTVTLTPSCAQPLASKRSNTCTQHPVMCNQGMHGTRTPPCTPRLGMVSTHAFASPSHHATQLGRAQRGLLARACQPRGHHALMQPAAWGLAAVAAIRARRCALEHRRYPPEEGWRLALGVLARCLGLRGHLSQLRMAHLDSGRTYA